MTSTWRTARSTGFVVGLTIAVLVAAGAMLTIVHSNSAAKQQQLVVSNYDTISAMRRALIALQDSELGQRAYLLTGNVANLEPYERARLRIDTNRGSLGSRAQGGFGLTLVHGLAMQLGGKAVVMPREGGGTRIVVTFPMPQEEGGDD